MSEPNLRTHGVSIVRPTTYLLVLLALTIFLPSCGKDRKTAVYPVEGKILVEGKPAKGVIVHFWPQFETDKEMHAVCPTGQSDDDGKFRLSTYTTDDGAPPGDYLLTFEWPLRFNVLSNRWEGDKLKGRFEDAQKSTIKATVEKKPTTIAPIDLK